MKIGKTSKALIICCLCIYNLQPAASQEWLFRAHSSEIFPESPATGCFLSSFADMRLRDDFGMKEMMHAQVNGNWVRGGNCLLTSLAHYGYTHYGDLQLAIGYGRNFGNRFSLCTRLFYSVQHARDYPARHSISTDFAFACRITPTLWVETTVFNPFLMRYGLIGKEVIPLKFSISCGYLPSRKLLVALTMSKSLPGAWEINGRILTQAAQPLLLAADCSNHRIALTVSIVHKRFLFNIQTAWHYRIALSPRIGMSVFPENMKP